MLSDLLTFLLLFIPLSCSFSCHFWESRQEDLDLSGVCAGGETFHVMHDIIPLSGTDGHLGLITECLCCGGGTESHLRCGKGVTSLRVNAVTQCLVTLLFWKPHDSMPFISITTLLKLSR